MNSIILKHETTNTHECSWLLEDENQLKESKIKN